MSFSLSNVLAELLSASTVLRVFKTILLVLVMSSEIIIPFLLNSFHYIFFIIIICVLYIGSITISWKVRAWLQSLPFLLLSCMVLGKSLNASESAASFTKHKSIKLPFRIIVD